MISDTPRRNGPYPGNGSGTAFPFDFRVFTTADVKVIKTDVNGVDTDKVINTDYTVTLNVDQANNPGGSVNMLVTPAVNELITLVGSLAYDQPTQFPTGGNYRAALHEDAADRLAAQIQQLVEMQGRQLTVAASVDTSGLDLASIKPEVGSALVWTTTGIASAAIDTAVLAAGEYSVQRFSGTGAQTAFTFSSAPPSQNGTEVFVAGLRQYPGVDYTVSGTTLTFAVAPASGSNNITTRWGNLFEDSGAAMLRADLASTTDSAKGRALVKIPRTAAEIAAGVTPTVGREHYEPGNWLRYGADPSTVSNSRTAIQNSVAQAGFGGQASYGPVGTYLSSGGRIVHNYAYDVVMHGDGKGTVIRGGAAGTDILLLAQSDDYVTRVGITLRDMSFDGVDGGQLSAALVQLNCECQVDDVYVYNGTRVSGVNGVNGIAVATAAPGGYQGRGVLNKVYVKGTSKGAIDISGNARDVTLNDCVAELCTGNGYTPALQINWASNVYVNNFTGRQCQGPAIFITDGSGAVDNVQIRGGLADDCGTGTLQPDNVFASVTGAGITNISVEGMKAINGGSVAGGGNNFYFGGVVGLKLSNLESSLARYSGLRIHNCTDVDINGGTFNDNNKGSVSGGAGIQYTGALSRVRTRGVSAKGTNAYGLYIDTGAVLTEFNVDDDCILQGNTTGSFACLGKITSGSIKLTLDLATTGASNTTVAGLILSSGSKCTLSTGVVHAGQKAGDGNGVAFYMPRVGAFYASGVTHTQQGATTVVAGDVESDAAWGGPSLDTATNSQVLVQVAGKLTTNITWKVPAHFLVTA